MNQDDIVAAIRNLLVGDGVAALVTLVDAPEGVGAKLLVTGATAAAGALPVSIPTVAVCEFTQQFLKSKFAAQIVAVGAIAQVNTEWSSARIMFERVQAEPRVVIFGAGHVGVAVARMAQLVGYSALLADDREQFLTREAVADETIELLHMQDWEQGPEQALIRGGEYVVVVTRGHNQDETCLRRVLAAQPRYIGMIGSKRRTKIVLDRLRAQGYDEQLLNTVHAPIGLDIGAVTPEEVALAIVAEIVLVRRGGSGHSLSSWRREVKA